MRSIPPAAALLGAAALVLSGRALLVCQTAYGEVASTNIVLHGSAVAGFLMIASLLYDLGTPIAQKRGFVLRMALLFATGAVLRFTAVIISPDPVNDVYAWHRDATEYLLNGQNPYSASYQSPYTL